MLSKAKIKLVQSLKDKKDRTENGLFVVEGNKNVSELLRSKIGVKTLFATRDWLIRAEADLGDSIELIEITPEEVKKVAFSSTPQEVVALAELPERKTTIPVVSGRFLIALDRVQDPGNLGTIIRIADWYGIDEVVCSHGCADAFAPKVIQATMGSFTRVTVSECDLDALCATNKVPVFGALMNGKSVYDTPMNEGILLIGNEGRGIDPQLQSYITHPVTIPGNGKAESLNAAIATAIICDNRARMMGR